MVTTNGDRSPWVTDAPNPIYRPPNGRLAPSSGRRVLRSISRTPIAHLVNARSPPPARFHAPFTQHIHALGRVMPGRPADAQASATVSALRSNCASCAQEVRSSVRTVGAHSGRSGSRFALRFALLVRTRLREPGANQSGSLLSKVWFPDAGFHYGFQGFTVFSTGNLDRPRPNPRCGVDWPARTIRASIEC